MCTSKTSIQHVYITASTGPHGEIERSPRTDKREFYRPFEYFDDVDLAEEVATWQELNKHPPSPRGHSRIHAIQDPS